jgi:hypothetical protein
MCRTRDHSGKRDGGHAGHNDEDGITFEIPRRIGLADGVFAEFGVGNGVENNTLAPAAAGWTGFWVDGEDLDTGNSPRCDGSRDRLP